MAKKKKKRISNNKEIDNTKSDIKAIALIAIGFILGVAIYTDVAGVLSIFATNVIYAFIGVLAYVIPIYLIYFGIDTIKCKGTIQYSRRIFGISLIVIIITLLFSTINLQGVEDVRNLNFGTTLKELRFFSNKDLHGGFLAYLITYPLSKLIGYIGSYILYLSLISVGSILIFDITLLDLFSIVRNFFVNILNGAEKKNIKKRVKVTKINDNFKEAIIGNDINKEEYISGINNKIEILDFMKNSDLEERSLLRDIDLENKNIQVEPLAKETEIKNIEKKTKGLSNDLKDNVDKEISNSINVVSSMEEKEYIYPNMNLLKVNSKSRLKSEDKKDLLDSASKLEETLMSFGVDAKVLQVTKGPSVTRFELQPSPGVKVSKIVNLQDDIALGLAASGVRMEAPIPGKAAIGIEVPNKKQSAVLLREVLDSKEFKNTDKKLAFSLGKDITGKCIVGDLSRMPHMLIAGATGSGKSVCINTLIISLLYKYSPKEVRLLMVDPKVVELSVYNGIPHLLIPVVTDPKKAAGALNWAVNEMNKRYNLFSEMKVKNIESYNSLFEKGIIDEKMPYVVIIVDELADLMMACPNDVEDYICRLAQMARAAGMHLIIATQRPSVDVITGVIKANIPSRVSFAVSSGTDSRTILDQVGAEKLLGRGDMLYYPIGENKPLRVQGAFISEEEVESVVDFIKQSEENIEYKEEILNHINSEVASTSDVKEEECDDLLEEAIKIVIEYQQASTSFIQRKLRVGFNRASRIMDELQERGIISEKDGSRPRQVLVGKNDYSEGDV